MNESCPPDVDKWHFTAQYCGGTWSRFERIDDGYLKGLFIGKWFVGWLR